jgi:hypothetical protein
LDNSVIDAIKRWPNVPAAWGWLSLTCRGEWRLHPLGDAGLGGPGESISNEHITGFINRNYVGDHLGQWLFQNGPQKVYVRLDSTPYILRTSWGGNGVQRRITTHNGLTIKSIQAWFVDQDGHVYALTDIGMGRVDDRDLIALTAQLKTPLGQSLDDLWPTLAHSNGLFETHQTLALLGAINPILEQPSQLFLVDTVDTLAHQYSFTRNPIAHA